MDPLARLSATFFIGRRRRIYFIRCTQTSERKGEFKQFGAPGGLYAF